MSPPFAPASRHVHTVTKYDLADRDEHGYYVGPVDSASDRGPLEAAYLRALGTFAAELGVERFEVRHPEFRPPADGDPAWATLHDCFGPDLSGLFDGALVDLRQATELLRLALREEGFWAVLEGGDALHVGVGWDQYLYLSTDRPVPSAWATVEADGLFIDQLRPWHFYPDGEEYVTTAADEDFWAKLADAADRRPLVLWEFPVRSGWGEQSYRLHPDRIPQIRTGLRPRTLLEVREFLSREPTLVAALPDADGVLRARWPT